MKTKILPSGLSDLEQGRDFYESQAEGLGIYFLESLFADIDSLVVYKGIHSKRFNCYRMLAKRFPYAVYYKIEDNIVIVYRVLDCRSDPKKHKKALK